jgi:hypothetical protein
VHNISFKIEAVPKPTGAWNRFITNHLIGGPVPYPITNHACALTPENSSPLKMLYSGFRIGDMEPANINFPSNKDTRDIAPGYLCYLLTFGQLSNYLEWKLFENKILRTHLFLKCQIYP